MRRFLLLAPVLLLVGCATGANLPPAPAQAERLPGANVLVVRTSVEPLEAYRQFARYLASHGFELETADETLMLIQTDYRDTDRMGSSARIKINASVEVAAGGAEITTRGRLFFAPLSSEDGMEIRNGGQAGSMQRRAFEELEEIVSGFPGGTLLYARQ
ncbi:MAG TPA: hypothetical protein VK610_04890 [Rhodothermales bacterium]|nr:hypothetical protein [Rhodothermales bacterium]